METHADLPILKEPEPKKKSNIKLIVILIVLFIGLLAVIFFNSSLSKISEVQITGTQFVNSAEIMKYSGLAVGDSFIFTSKKKIEENLLRNSSILQVTVTKRFPGHIKIHVQEYKVAAFELSENGELVALLASGSSIVTNSERMQLMDKPILTGWEADSMDKKELIKQLASLDPALLSDISEISPIPSQAFPDRILMYTRTKFEIITAISLLPEKIVTVNSVIETQVPGRVTLLLADTFVPFPQIGEEESVESE